METRMAGGPGGGTDDGRAIVLVFGEPAPQATEPWPAVAAWVAREAWRRLRGKSALRLDLSKSAYSDADIVRAIGGSALLLMLSSAAAYWRFDAEDPLGGFLGAAFCLVFGARLIACFVRDVPMRSRMRREIVAECARARRAGEAPRTARWAYAGRWVPDRTLVREN